MAISYEGRIVDKTGLNYIMHDSHANEMYKIARANFDVGRTHPKYRFDIDKNPAKKNAAKHIDAHIPADQWYKWRDIWKPDGE